MPASQRRDEAAQAIASGIISNNVMVESLAQQAENDSGVSVEERIAIKSYEIADFMEALA